MKKQTRLQKKIANQRNKYKTNSSRAQNLRYWKKFWCFIRYEKTVVSFDIIASEWQHWTSHDDAHWRGRIGGVSREACSCTTQCVGCRSLHHDPVFNRPPILVHRITPCYHHHNIALDILSANTSNDWLMNLQLWWVFPMWLRIA